MKEKLPYLAQAEKVDAANLRAMVEEVKNMLVVIGLSRFWCCELRVNNIIEVSCLNENLLRNKDMISWELQSFCTGCLTFQYFLLYCHII